MRKLNKVMFLILTCVFCFLVSFGFADSIASGAKDFFIGLGVFVASLALYVAPLAVLWFGFHGAYFISTGKKWVKINHV